MSFSHCFFSSFFILSILSIVLFISIIWNFTPTAFQLEKKIVSISNLGMQIKTDIRFIAFISFLFLCQVFVVSVFYLLFWCVVVHCLLGNGMRKLSTQFIVLAFSAVKVHTEWYGASKKTMKETIHRFGHEILFAWLTKWLFLE